MDSKYKLLAVGATPVVMSYLMVRANAPRWAAEGNVKGAGAPDRQMNMTTGPSSFGGEQSRC
jgi:hypothetical protein